MAFFVLLLASFASLGECVSGRANISAHSGNRSVGMVDDGVGNINDLIWVRSRFPVYLRSGITGKHIDVEGETVQARSEEFGGSTQDFDNHESAQRFVIAKAAPWHWRILSPLSSEGEPAINSGDVVYLEAHTGKLLEVEGTSVQAKEDHWEARQRFVIEKSAADIEKDGSKHIWFGSVIYLKSHTGNYIDVDPKTNLQADEYKFEKVHPGIDIQARWPDQGSWQAFVIEEPRCDYVCALTQGEKIMNTIFSRDFAEGPLPNTPFGFEWLNYPS